MAMRRLKLCLAFLLISILAGCQEEKKVDQRVSEAASVQEKEVPRTREEIVLSFAPVIKKVAPAVVNIYAMTQAKGGYPKSPFMQDPFFRQFFDYLYPDVTSEHSSLGSAVIVSPDGLLLTNYHVIEDADVIRVVMSDKREYMAKLVILDKKTDLALLKIQDGSDFPYFTISAEQDLEVGDIVLAIGNPFGVGQTVTSGIISALARSQEGISDYRSFIQTDAAINPGNSGGALITTDGRLVGINTAIYSKTGGSMGIGFAVPVNLAIPVIKSVEHGGQIARPWLGLSILPIPFELSKKLGFKRPYGVQVVEVYPGGPADKAGLQKGDYILEMDGKELADDAALDYRVAISPVGKTAQLTILRGGERQVVPVILLEPMPDAEPKPTLVNGENPLQGAKLLDLTPSLAIELGEDPAKPAVVVTAVLNKGTAGRLGVQPGDILESINQHKVTSVREAIKYLDASEGKWSIVVRRQGRLLKLQVTNR